MINHKKIISTLYFLLISTIVLAQSPVKIGIWESFNPTLISSKNNYKNKKEKFDQKDEDKNQYVDDIYGIYFNSKEQIKGIVYTDSLETTHGDYVSAIILKHYPQALLTQVGFVPIAQRLNDTGLAQMTVVERLAHLPTEYQQIDEFVQKSIAYFVAKKVQIVNISWGIDLDQIIKLNPNFGNDFVARKKIANEWLNYFEKSLTTEMKNHPQIIFVIAAGNEGKDIAEIKSVPAIINLPNTITVGALNEDLTAKAAFSNYGSILTIFAPGTKINYFNQDKARQETINGTSFATPIITAYIAKLLTQKNKKTPKNIKAELKKIYYLK